MYIGCCEMGGSVDREEFMSAISIYCCTLAGFRFSLLLQRRRYEASSVFRDIPFCFAISSPIPLIVSSSSSFRTCFTLSFLCNLCNSCNGVLILAAFFLAIASLFASRRCNPSTNSSSCRSRKTLYLFLSSSITLPGMGGRISDGIHVLSSTSIRSVSMS